MWNLGVKSKISHQILTTDSLIFAVTAVFDPVTPELLADAHLVLSTIELLIFWTDCKFVLRDRRRSLHEVEGLVENTLRRRDGVALV